MAKHNADWTPDTETPPATYPKTRDELMQKNRARRETEPAAAPQETDSESGSPAAVPPTARTEPARTHAVNVSEAPSDVRAGPGDAGAADTPTEKPRVAQDYNDSWRKAIMWIAIVAGIGILLALVI